MKCKFVSAQPLSIVESKLPLPVVWHQRPPRFRRWLSSLQVFVEAGPNTSLLPRSRVLSSLTTLLDRTFGTSQYPVVSSCASTHANMYSLRLIIYWFSLILQEVNALNAVGPYEAVYFYSAYKMEFATRPAGSRTIAVGARANAMPALAPPHVVELAFIAETVAAGMFGICSFDHFLKWIKTSGRNAFVPDNPRNPYPRSISVTLNPSADEIAAKLTPAGVEIRIWTLFQRR